jgi:hypothetical protein
MQADASLQWGAAAKRANPSRGGGAKPNGLRKEIAGLPNRVAVLFDKHLKGEEERKMRLRSNSSE